MRHMPAAGGVLSICHASRSQSQEGWTQRTKVRCGFSMVSLFLHLFLLSDLELCMSCCSQGLGESVRMRCRDQRMPFVLEPTFYPPVLLSDTVHPRKSFNNGWSERRNWSVIFVYMGYIHHRGQNSYSAILPCWVWETTKPCSGWFVLT